MAAIYDYETGNELTAGLQGSRVCDEAIQAARRMAEERGAPVLLEDDGEYIVGAEGAIAYKYADPTESARWVYDEADLASIKREDASLVVELRE